MPFPKLPILWSRVCPAAVFCDEDKARRFLAEIMVDLEDTNPDLFKFLNGVLMDQTSAYVRSAHFDAVNCAAAICKLCKTVDSLPVITAECISTTLDEFERDPALFIHSIVEMDMDINSAAIISVCSENYRQFGYYEEADFVRDTALKVYRMIELSYEESVKRS